MLWLTRWVKIAPAAILSLAYWVLPPALYQSQFGREPAAYDPSTWDATTLLVLSAEAAQDITGPAVRDRIRDVANGPGQEVTDVYEALSLLRAGQEINYQGASGAVDLDENGDVVSSYDLWTVADDGSIEVLDTISGGGS